MACPSSLCICFGVADATTFGVRDLLGALHEMAKENHSFCEALDESKIYDFLDIVYYDDDVIEFDATEDDSIDRIDFEDSETFLAEREAIEKDFVRVMTSIILWNLFMIIMLFILWRNPEVILCQGLIQDK